MDSLAVVSGVPDAAMCIEVVVVRDPDRANEIFVFCDGAPVVDFMEFEIDAGSGWQWDDWKASRDHSLRVASAAVRERLLGIYSSPPGDEYIEGKPDDVGWLDGVDEALCAEEGK